MTQQDQNKRRRGRLSQRVGEDGPLFLAVPALAPLGPDLKSQYMRWTRQEEGEGRERLG